MFLVTNTSISTLYVNEGNVSFKLYPQESVTLSEAQLKALGDNTNPALLVTSVDGTQVPEKAAHPVVDGEAAVEAIANIPNTRLGSESISPMAARDLDRTSDEKLAIYNDREKIEILEGDKDVNKIRADRRKKLEELKKSGTVEENKTPVAKAADPEGNKKTSEAKATEVKK